MDGPLAYGFNTASRFLAEAVKLIPDDRWSSPGLGEWTLLELVGHANRGQITIEEYLLRPQSPEPRGSGYFSEAAIAERGRAAVAALGNDPKAATATASERIIELVGATSEDTTIGSPAGTMRLVDYLPSRIAELTIHGIDVVRAVGTDLAAPSEAVAVSLEFVTRRVLNRGAGEQVLMALAGRTKLLAEFSVL